MTPPAADPPVVLVTGAAGGLGRALALAFHDAGWRVAAAGHSTLPEGLPETAWRGTLDVRSPDSVAATVGAVLGRWGRLDALVNNAGVNLDRLLLQTDADDWQAVIDVSLKGAFLCSRAALGPMSRQGSGLILNVASHAARSGPAGQSAYAAAKAGLIGLTLALAREVGASGIRVNAVLPGVLPTAMTSGLSATAWDAFRAAGTLGRLNPMGEVARWIVSMAGWSGVSGQVLSFDSRVTRWT